MFAQTTNCEQSSSLSSNSTTAAATTTTTTTSSSSNSSSPGKRKRVLLALAQKVLSSDAVASDGSYKVTERRYRIGAKAAEKSIRPKVLNGYNNGNKAMYPYRSPAIEVMETKLNEWIRSQSNARVRFTNGDITAMAVHLFKETKPPEDGTIFVPNNSWLCNFKKRYSITSTMHRTPLKQRTLGQQPKDQSDPFKTEARLLIQENGYLPEQVFNIDDDFLYWKRIPVAYLRGNQEKLSLLYGCNASGDFMAKPMIVYKGQSPFGINDEVAPLFWRTNPWEVVSDAELRDWFLSCFLPAVWEYLASKNLTTPILILMENNTRNHMLSKMEIPNVNFKLFPPKTKSFIQPLSQGVFAAFHRYYLRRMLSHLSQKMFLEPSLNLSTCWQEYNIIDCMEIIKDAFDEISASDVNYCWKALWPEIVHEQSTPHNVQMDIDDIVQVVKEINDPRCYGVNCHDVYMMLGQTQRTNFESDIRKEDNNNSKINGSVGSTSTTLDGHPSKFNITVQDSKDMIIVRNEADHPIPVNSTVNAYVEQPPPPLGMIRENLHSILASADALEQLVLKFDPSAARSMTFSKGLQLLLRPYKIDHL